MENIKFLGAANEVQKIYNDLGLLVPVGDLSTGKEPAVQVLPATSTLDSITFNFNVTSSADITSITYETSSQQTGTITPKKGVVSVTFDSLEYNTELEISLYVTNASGTTTVYTAAETQHYTNWATPDEVLEGNKYIGEDGQETVGTYVPEEAPDGLSYLGIPVFEYSISEDPNTGENVIDYARLVEGSHARSSEWADAGLGAIDSYQIWYRWTTNDGQGNIDGTLLEWTAFESIDNPGATYVDLSSVLNADALANGTYFLEAYEIIRYNGVEYATECITYPEDVYEGGPVIQSGQLDITENGETDVTGYDSVNVDVPTITTKAAITFDYDTGTKYQIMGTLITNDDFEEVDGFELTIQEPSEYAGITISSHPAGQKCMKIGENEYVFYEPFYSLPPNVTDLSGNGTITVVTSTDPMNPQFADYPITWTCDHTESFTAFTLSNCTLTQVTAPDQGNSYGEWQFSGTSDADMTQIGFEGGDIRLYADDNSTVGTAQLEQIDPNDPYTVKSSTFVPLEAITSSGMYAIGCMYDSNTWDIVSNMPWGTWTNASNH